MLDLLFEMSPDVKTPRDDPATIQIDMHGVARANLAQMVAEALKDDPDLAAGVFGRDIDSSRIVVNGREIAVPPGFVNEIAALADKPPESLWGGFAPPTWAEIGESGAVSLESKNSINALLAFIWGQLHAHSPIGVDLHDPHPALYAHSHVLLVDGEEMDDAAFDLNLTLGGGAPNAIGSGSTFVFYNSQPYAGKIEEGESPQFPDGLYQSVAAMASRQWETAGLFNGDSPIGSISFAWDGPGGAPAITVKRTVFA